ARSGRLLATRFGPPPRSAPNEEAAPRRTCSGRPRRRALASPAASHRSSARQGRRRTSVRPSLSATLRRPTPTTLRWPVRARSQTPAPLRPANDRRRRAPSRAPAPAPVFGRIPDGQAAPSTRGSQGGSSKRSPRSAPAGSCRKSPGSRPEIQGFRGGRSAPWQELPVAIAIATERLAQLLAHFGQELGAVHVDLESGDA